MKVNGYIKIPTEVDLKVGDRCVIITGYRKGKILTIKKVMENRTGVKVVFDDNTWRPADTYGISWQKVIA